MTISIVDKLFSSIMSGAVMTKGKNSPNISLNWCPCDSLMEYLAASLWEYPVTILVGTHSAIKENIKNRMMSRKANINVISRPFIERVDRPMSFTKRELNTAKISSKAMNVNRTGLTTRMQ